MEERRMKIHNRIVQRNQAAEKAYPGITKKWVYLNWKTFLVFVTLCIIMGVTLGNSITMFLPK